ncbi:MAG TPA: hypothetical protein PKC67_06925 [Kiritimatiellia bacterium]|nr:hypothetical protein [Kiritimatiellia bacterium]HMP34070.1 hypothetical protein [Kiritimatiellia bacterium]
MTRTSMRLAATAFAALLATASAPAQRADLPARIALKNLPGATDIVLTARRGNTLHARLNDATGSSITYDTADVRRLAFNLPADAVGRAEAAAASGNTAEAARQMRVVIVPILPYLDLPTDGVVPHAFTYAGWLRRDNAWTAAMSVYRAMTNHAELAIREQALAWLAYGFARNQQPNEARALIEGLTIDDPRHEGFMPAALAAVIVATADTNDTRTIDLAARATALARIDHELYPESLFRTAAAYHRLAATAAFDEAHPPVVLRKAGEEPPPTPPLNAAELTTAASNLYQRVTTLFPSSPFAADATRDLGRLPVLTNTTAHAITTTAPGASR